MLPAGEAVYPALSRPDTKYNPLGDYKANTRVPKDDAKATIAALQKIAKDHIGKALPIKKNALWEFEVDNETGEETGYVVFKIKAKNKQLKDGSTWDRRPLIIDGKRNTVPASVAVWGGSRIRVKVEVYCFKTKDGPGMSLQPVTVQVLKLVTGTGGQPDISGFDEDEDGYVIEEDTSDFDGGNAGDTGGPEDADY